MLADMKTIGGSYIKIKRLIIEEIYVKEREKHEYI
jgi:hypothetical protein